MYYLLWSKNELVLFMNKISQDRNANMKEIKIKIFILNLAHFLHTTKKKHHS